MANASDLGEPPTEPHDSQPDTIARSETEALELFRRSPHPYHRSQHELNPEPTSSEGPRNGLLRARLASPNAATRNGDGIGVKETDGHSRDQGQKASPSLSESGTEADDEGYGFVRALPAPPLQPRKGLRRVRGSGLDGDATPLLTPSQVDEEGRKLPGHYFQRTRDVPSTTGSTCLTDDEAAAAAARQNYLKYLKRRRNEIVRRVTEAMLLAAIAALAVGGCGCWQQLLQRHRGTCMPSTLRNYG